jgi:hypothetical protein
MTKRCGGDEEQTHLLSHLEYIGFISVHGPSLRWGLDKRWGTEGVLV